MKPWKLIFIAVVALTLPFLRADAETRTQTQKIAFSNPQQPGTLIIQSGRGNVTVAGYSGREVVVDVTTTNENALPAEDEKAKGMRRITGSSFGITKNTDENSIVITPAKSGTTDMTIKVPAGTSLKIGEMSYMGTGVVTTNVRTRNRTMIAEPFFGTYGFRGGTGYNGNISVEGVTGDMEIATQEGDVVLRGVSGGMTVNTNDGDITAVFSKVPVRPAEASGGNPIALSATHGDIDITVPASVRATITAKNVEGDIYTDHDMEIVATVQEKSGRGRPAATAITVTPKSPGAPKNDDINKERDKEREDAERFRAGLEKAKQQYEEQVQIMQINQSMFDGAFFGNSVTGTINGGGSDVQLTTFNGNIYIRKAK